MAAAPTPRAPLLPGLDEQSTLRLEARVVRREVAAGEVLMREGEPARELIFLAAGELSVLKREKHHRRREHRIARVLPGEVCGELELIDGQPAAATVRAAMPSVVYVLPLDRGDPALDLALKRHLARLLAARLRGKAEESLATSIQRAATGEFVVDVLVLLALYAVLVSALPVFSQRLSWDVALLSFPLQAVFGIGALRFIRTSGYPLADFGIGARYLLRSLLDAIVFTVPVLALVTGLKAAYLLVTAAPASLPLIDHPDLAAQWGNPQVRLWFGIYVVSCVVQELIVRGALQSSLELFLVGPHRRRRAVLVSALLFAVNHLHLSFAFAAAAFIPGLFWGWLFARHRNLVGPTLSHVVVGAYVFFVMGVPVAT